MLPEKIRLLDVSIGVHNDCFADELAAKEVARLSEFGIIEAFEEHDTNLSTTCVRGLPFRLPSSVCRLSACAWTAHYRDPESTWRVTRYPFTVLLFDGVGRC